MRSEFWIHLDKEQDYDNKSFQWYVKSLKFKYGSDEWMICRLKMRIYDRQSLKHLMLATKYLYE